MTIASETLLSAQTHPGDSVSVTTVGDQYKGDGYYGRSDGLHTVQYTYTGFTGTIAIEATLAVTPEDSDWFTVFFENIDQDTASKITNFTGNYVWIRAKIIYTDGTVNAITLNH